MSPEYEKRVIAVIVVEAGEPIFSESATHVRIEDEAAGEFVVVQQSAGEPGTVKFNPEEWPAIRKAIDAMVKECRE